MSRSAPPLQVVAVVGTRPEAIKMAPVIRAMHLSSDFESVLVSTGQHQTMLDQALADFGLEPDRQLPERDPATAGLSALCAGIMAELAPIVDELQPDVILVQGDTTSTLSGALVGYHAKIPVAHLEAGLRTGNLLAPHPEEGNRRLTAQLADLHLAPTPETRANLLREGVPPGAVVVTGNTVIDALHWMARQVEPRRRSRTASRSMLVTAHRRESWGQGIAEIATAVARIASSYPSLEVLMPLHANPIVRVPLERTLAGHRNVVLTEPLSYRALVSALLSVDLVLTDSGGLQEEAPSLSKPVLVMRDLTERPEAVKAGCAKLVGTKVDSIVDAVSEVLDNPRTFAAMARSINPYGDGMAADRVIGGLLWRYRDGEPPVHFRPES